MASCSPLIVGGADASPWRAGRSGTVQMDGRVLQWGQITPDSACRGAAGARSTPLSSLPLYLRGRGGGEASLSPSIGDDPRTVEAPPGVAVHHMIHAPATPGEQKPT